MPSLVGSEMCLIFFFQAEDGIRDFCLSRGLGDVYKRQPPDASNYENAWNYKRFDPSVFSELQTRQKEVEGHSATDGSKGRYAIPFR